MKNEAKLKKKQWNYVVQAKSLMKADIQSRIGADC